MRATTAPTRGQDVPHVPFRSFQSSRIMGQQMHKLFPNAHAIRAIAKQPKSTTRHAMAEFTQISECARFDLPQPWLSHHQFIE
jgi:hypothetical protein